MNLAGEVVKIKQEPEEDLGYPILLLQPINSELLFKTEAENELTLPVKQAKRVINNRNNGPLVCMVKERCTGCGNTFSCLSDTGHVCAPVFKSVGLHNICNAEIEKLPGQFGEIPHKYSGGGVGSAKNQTVNASTYTNTGTPYVTELPRSCFYTNSSENTNSSKHYKDLRKEGPHKCEHCGSTFALKHSLKTHKRKHAGCNVTYGLNTASRLEHKGNNCITKSAKSHKCSNRGSVKDFERHMRKTVCQSTKENRPPSLHTRRNKLSSCNDSKNKLAVNYTRENLFLANRLHKVACDKRPRNQSLPNLRQPLSKSNTSISFCNPNNSQSSLMDVKPFSCADCGNSFTTKYNLSEHTRVMHEGDKPYACKPCGKVFGSKSTLDKHNRRIHSNVKPHVCLECGLGCTSKGDLARHGLVHTGEREFKCKICAAAFSCVSYLNRHMFIHTGEKKFKCETCSKTFAYKTHMQIHYRVHTKEKPYKCDVCGVFLGSKQALKFHSRRHAEDGKKLTSTLDVVNHAPEAAVSVTNLSSTL